MKNLLAIFLLFVMFGVAANAQSVDTKSNDSEGGYIMLDSLVKLDGDNDSLLYESIFEPSAAASFFVTPSITFGVAGIDFGGGEMTPSYSYGAMFGFDYLVGTTLGFSTGLGFNSISTKYEFDDSPFEYSVGMPLPTNYTLRYADVCADYSSHLIYIPIQLFVQRTYFTARLGVKLAYTFQPSIKAEGLWNSSAVLVETGTHVEEGNPLAGSLYCVENQPQTVSTKLGSSFMLIYSADVAWRIPMCNTSSLLLGLYADCSYRKFDNASDGITVNFYQDAHGANRRLTPSALSIERLLYLACGLKITYQFGVK